MGRKKNEVRKLDLEAANKSFEADVQKVRHDVTCSNSFSLISSTHVCLFSKLFIGMKGPLFVLGCLPNMAKVAEFCLVLKATSVTDRAERSRIIKHKKSEML